MEDEMNFIVDNAKENMDHAIAHLEKEMLNIRAGKANPIMLAGVKVEYYGTPTPLSQVANISTPDARTLAVQPWEKNLISDIEKAILIANLGNISIEITNSLWNNILSRDITGRIQNTSSY